MQEETEEVASCLDAGDVVVVVAAVVQAALSLPPLVSPHVMAAAVEAASPFSLSTPFLRPSVSSKSNNTL